MTPRQRLTHRTVWLLLTPTLIGVLIWSLARAQHDPDQPSPASIENPR